MPVLLPGVGAQGGSLEDVVTAFAQNNKSNYIINISRGLIYIDDGKDFGKKIKLKIEDYNTKVRDLIK
jgi:orotidine-5'-phosphate decarboxylase